VTLAWGGYYTKVMDSGLHAIALQTNYYDEHNMFLTWGVDHWDLGGQLSWLEDVLGQIAAKGQRAVIMSHELPKNFASGVWALKFQAIVEKYHESIVAILAGHIHNDMTHISHTRASFMSTFHGSNSVSDAISKEPWLQAKEAEVEAARHGQQGSIAEAEPILVEYLASSVTPVEHSTNPCYRVYDMDRAKLVFTDYTQYKLDLDEANKYGGAAWEVEYTARKEYGLVDMSARSWHEFALRMAQDKQLTDKYNNNYSAGHARGSMNFTNAEAACNVLAHMDDERRACLAEFKA
jgi:hypothetical protein